MNNQSDRRESEELADRGYEYLDAGEPEAALAVAAELEKLRYSAAFEIAALAHQQLGDLDAAIATLKRGLSLAPTVWLNWQLLGNFLSYLSRYEKAAVAYERALTCPGVDTSSIRLNQAILALRRGRYAEALSYAEQVADPRLFLQAARLRVAALAGGGHIEEAISTGEATLSKLAGQASVDAAWLAEAIGRARMELGLPHEDILAFALSALETWDRGNPGLLALIRDVDAQRSDSALYYRMTVEAKTPSTDAEDEEAAGYFVTYEVVADTVAEALQFVQRLEDPSVRDKLVVDEYQSFQDHPMDMKGVYSRTARIVYGSAA